MHSAFDFSILQLDPDAPNRFLDRLAKLGRGDWFEAMERARLQRDRSAAAAMLEAVVAHHGLSVDGWYVSDGVETAAQCVFGNRGHVSPADHGLLREARDTATVAALAVLVRSLLSEEQFGLLYHPFAAAIPAATVVSI